MSRELAGLENNKVIRKADLKQMKKNYEHGRRREEKEGMAGMEGWL